MVKQDDLAKNDLVDRGMASSARYTYFVLKDIIEKYEKGLNENGK